MENNITRQNQALIEGYLSKYEDQYCKLESLPVGRVRRITNDDVVALGEQLDAWKRYESMQESQGTLNNLGIYPRVALDVLTISYGTNPVSLFASVQSIPNQYGTVYALSTVADTYKGNITAPPEVLYSWEGGREKTLENYANDRDYDDVITPNGTTYTHTLKYFPRKATIQINVEGNDTLIGRDIGDEGGSILGNGVFGSVNYDVRTMELTFNEAPTAPIHVRYQINYEQEDDLPIVGPAITQIPVRAEVFALKGLVGLLESFDFRVSRGGGDLETIVAEAIIGEMNTEISAKFIRQAKRYLGNPYADNNPLWTNWSLYAPAGSNDPTVLWRETIRYALTNADTNLFTSAGRGEVNTYIAGVQAAAVLKDTPGFTLINDWNASGIFLYGTLDGRPVIKVTDPTVLPPWQIIGLYKSPTDSFDAAMVWAVYMPLVVLPPQPNGKNPLVSQQAAAVWGATAMVAPQLMTGIVIDPTRPTT